MQASDAVPGLTPGVTLVFRIGEPVSGNLVPSLTGEIARLFADTGILIRSRLISDVTPKDQFVRLVVISLQGRCSTDLRAPEHFQSGALAFTHRSDGEILPFVDVLCDRIRALIWPAMSGEQFRDPDAVLARALGRVIAHELYHVLGRTCSHGSTGLAQHALSGEELIGDQLAFGIEDLRMIQAAAAGGG